jgi:hypothetical protein
MTLDVLSNVGPAKSDSKLILLSDQFAQLIESDYVDDLFVAERTP